MNTLIVNHPTMEVGGIENFLFARIKDALDKGYRVIWLHYTPIVIAKEYQEIGNQIEKLHIPVHFRRSSVIKRLHFSKDEQITIVSFTPIAHEFAFRIKKKYQDNDITALYIIANAKGKAYYNENYYFQPFKGWTYKVLSNVHREWVEKNSIRFFTKQQRMAFEKNYHISFDNPDAVLFPPFRPFPLFDREKLIQRAKREQFNLVSVSRFDFPHKNYLLGLVDDYAELKTKYPKLHLHIIGYGEGEGILMNKINSLPSGIRRDIRCYGKSTSEQIDSIMGEMHLNISVAGSVSCGARNGVLSIPARNFCGEKCEVYGYLPNSFDMKTSLEPGERAIRYIEEVISMSEEDYIVKCDESFNAYNHRKFEPHYLYSQKNNGMVRESLCTRIFFDVLLWTAGTSYKLKRAITGKKVD